MRQVKVTFDSGNVEVFDQGITLKQVIKKAFPEQSSKIIAVRVNDRIAGLYETLENDAEIKVLTCDEADGMQIFWHSASHIMAQAVKSLYKNVSLGIGPAVANGFYYDFHLSETISSDDFVKLEKKIKEIIKENQLFVKKVLTKKEVIEFFEQRNEPFKVELINEIDDETVSIFQNGDFVDLCRGPHVYSTGVVKHIKLLSVAGAYWRGDERNPVMQRIYGVAFPKKEQLENHLRILEEAQKRDHRKLGKELNLFSFHVEGPGFPFWHSNGMVIYNEIQDYMRNLLNRRGYQEIKTPVILNEDLWHRSGHWDNYKNNMYFTTIDEQTYAVKPMNCPGGLLVYKSEAHSYKELPLKLSEMGLVHRHEKSGVLHGLFRVRQFTQDDAHVFCTEDQIEDEIIKLIDLIYEVYTNFGFNEFFVELSTKPEKAIGSDEIWERAETALKNALIKKEVDYKLNPGEGAFYGPKIDFHIRDSLSRLWQCGTIQVDFSMPERFELEYTGQDGQKHRPVMIHRAILGSVERFIGILIEHYGGAFPIWLAPVQVVVIPVSEKHVEYAKTVYEKMAANSIRVKLDDRSEKLGYKIRNAEVQKIPYMCIVGDKEQENNSVSVRKHKKGDVGSVDVESFVSDIIEQIKRRVND